MQQFESFAQMQRDAAMRVMEMQRRAQAAMRDSPPQTLLPAAAEPPADSPLFDPDRGEEPRREEMRNPDRQENPVKPELSQEDTERALITAILLLLMRENADERLLFALLYILM
ncbi:MAG: hypothetical protein IJM51_05730 [Clostridia bacterium]|nr:hypothetical protein [Clostridia bacterium]